MTRRRLDAEERALWGRVVADVTPLPGRTAEPSPLLVQSSRPMPAQPAGGPVPTAAANRPRPIADETLDGGWDRRLRRGVVTPDATIDLHGHTLITAHAALDHMLDRAVTHGARVILVITGRPPRPTHDGARRGLIRASIHDWLARSRYGERIAAVRGAHPRHGGAGALYVILRRDRERGRVGP